MIWYLVFTGMFVLYQLDVIVYSIIALCAKFQEVWNPEPGHPWYWWWHKDELVPAPECDKQGYRICTAMTPVSRASPDAADAGAAGKNSAKQEAAAAADGAAVTEAGVAVQGSQGGWNIPTTNRVSISSLTSSYLAGSSAPYSSGSGSVPSDCSASAAGSSHPSTPQAGQAGTPKATLQRLLDQQQQQQQSMSQLETVYSMPDQTPADAPTSPHMSAKGLRCRHVAAEDSADGQQQQQQQDGAASPSSIADPQQQNQQQQLQLGWYTGDKGRPSISLPAGGGQPPSSCVVLGPDKACSLPASLVSLYDYFPVVLVQLPMYNEEAHCEVVIERACNIIWPRERIIIQACDDSTREDVKQRIDAKVAEVQQRGHHCLVTRRSVNKGFKAGNMINGMSYLNEVPWEFVAVFDADFEMPPDFLFQTIWHMQQDSRLGFVQGRWSFTNGYDNMLCWMQQVCLNYHFAVEQRARSFLRTFFGFNGTAGVWRRTAMEQAGGWNMESTVEDMDLSLRAYLNGWKFKYLHWVGCPNELPPTMSAYKTQQYRWNSGPMVVIKQLVARIWTTDQVTFWDRISCSYFFFRFIYSAFLTVICLVCPAIVIWLDPWSWSWAPMMFLIAGNTSAAFFIWFAGLLFWPYFLMQTGVGYFRVYAMVNGLLGSKKSGTWKVTKKFGKGGLSNRVYHKPYMLELLMALVFFGYAFAAVWYGVYVLGSFCWIMAWTFVIISFGEYLF